MVVYERAKYGVSVPTKINNKVILPLTLLCCIAFCVILGHIVTELGCKLLFSLAVNTVQRLLYDVESLRMSITSLGVDLGGLVTNFKDDVTSTLDKHSAECNANFSVQCSTLQDAIHNLSTPANFSDVSILTLKFLGYRWIPSEKRH